MNCVQCNELLFDFVYGLLDAPDAKVVREHSASCEACAAELAKAKVDQQKLSRAALAIADVAPFPMPSERVAPETSPLPAAPVETPATPRRRGVRPITMIAWAATLACCALVAVIFAFNHRQRLDQQESQVADLTRRHDDVQTQLALLDANFALEQKRIPDFATKDVFQFHVAGPGVVMPGASAGYQVAIRDLDGAVRPGKVEASFFDAKNQPVATRTIDVGSNVTLPIPDELTKVHGSLRMKLVASTGTKTVAVVEETIVSAKPVLAAHIALNKLVYKPGDKLQMRALVVDRFTLQPAAAASKFDVELVNENGQAAAPAVGLTTFAGIGAGEVVLPPNLREGNYTLQARGDGLSPVNRRIEVLPVAAPPVEFVNPNNRFRAGEPITQQLQLNYKDGAPAANTPVYGNATISEQTGNVRANGLNLQNNAVNPRNNFANPQANRAFKFEGNTDATGKVEFKVPEIPNVQTGSQQLQAEVIYGGDKKNRATVSRELLVQPSRVVVEFFPEGGRLIAGTDNRVFYRVRAPEGGSTASARIAIQSSKERVFEANTESSLGSFHIKPDAKETYTLKILSPQQDDVKDPFAALGIQSDGLLLRGDAVQTSPGPMRLTLENRGRERLVQIVATCRGQIVFHTRTPIKAPETPLEIAGGADGLYRVTAFEVKDDQLTPLTERLFFRPASRRLEVVVDANSFKNSAQFNVNGFDERKQPLAFWALACIADDRFRGDALEPSLSSHFLLLGDAPIDTDLSELPIVNLDGAFNKVDLELTLGVFGWRRVGAPTANPAMIAQAAAPKVDVPARAKDARPVDAAGVSFFYRVEPSLFELRQKFEHQFQATQLALVEAAGKQQRELAQQRNEIAQQLANARFELNELAKRPREQILAGLGILALVLLAVGALAMAYGMAKLMRRQPAGALFGAACGCLAVCFALMVFRPDDSAENAAVGKVAKGRSADLKEFQARAAAPLGKLAEARHSNSKVSLPDRVRDENIAAPEKRDGPNPALTEPAEQPIWTRRFVADGVPGPQFPKLDQSRQGMVADLNNANNGQRGPAPNASFANDRNITLVPAPYAPAQEGIAKGGFGGGFGGGGAFGGPAKGGSAKSAKAQAADGGGGMGSPMPRMATAPGAPGALELLKKDKETPPKTGVGQKSPLIGAMRSIPADPSKNATVVPPIQGVAKKYLDSDAYAQSQQRIDLDALTRQFAPRHTQDLADPATLLWDPALLVPALGKSISVDVPALPARYRVLFFGHTEDGRFGSYDGVLYSK